MKAEDEQSYRDIIKEEFFYVAKSVDNSITINAIGKAIDAESDKIKFKNELVIWGQIGFISFSLAAIFILAVYSKSPAGKFLGTFWITILTVEFLYYLFHRWRKR